MNHSYKKNISMLKRWSLNEAEPPPPRDVHIAFRNQRISTCIIPIYKMVSLSSPLGHRHAHTSSDTKAFSGTQKGKGHRSLLSTITTCRYHIVFTVTRLANSDRCLPLPILPPPPQPADRSQVSINPRDDGVLVCVYYDNKKYAGKS